MRNGMNFILCFQVKQRAQQHDENAKSCDDYLRQIGYREYSRYLSFHFPFTHERSLLEHLRATPWRFDHRHFKVKTHLNCACQHWRILSYWQMFWWASKCMMHHPWPTFCLSSLTCHTALQYGDGKMTINKCLVLYLQGKHYLVERLARQYAEWNI